MVKAPQVYKWMDIAMHILHRDIDIQHYISDCSFLLIAGTISWNNKMHTIITLSSTKTKYMTTIHVAKEVVWL